MTEISSKIEVYCGCSISSYLKLSGMEKDKTWGTEVEVYATSSLLNVPIFIFAPYKPKQYEWLKYDLKTNEHTEHDGEAIYLRNVCEHFEPVYEI
jgi:hypothetical protein